MACRWFLLLCGMFYLVNGQLVKRPPRLDPKDILDGTPPKGYTCCHGYPDIHYYTFDQKMINYHGKCKHNVATPDNIDFRIEVVAYWPAITTGPSWPKYWDVTYACTRVRVYSTQLTLSKTPDFISQGFTTVFSSIAFQNGMEVYKDANNVIVMIPTGAYLWITDQAGGGFACVHGSYKAMMTGICGNFDGNAGNDERTSAARTLSGPVGQRHHTIGNSWQVYDPEDECCVNDPGPPKSSLLAHKSAKKICKMLKREGPFSGCVRKVTKLYFKTCMADVQAINVDDGVISPAVACKALENAALQCMLRNTKIPDTWKNETGCGTKGIYGPWEETRNCTRAEGCHIMRERLCLTGFCTEPLTQKRGGFGGAK